MGISLRVPAIVIRPDHPTHFFFLFKFDEVFRFLSLVTYVNLQTFTYDSRTSILITAQQQIAYWNFVIKFIPQCFPDKKPGCLCDCLDCPAKGSFIANGGRLNATIFVPNTHMYMVFRLPTHLESFVPPPSHQVPQPRPWRGTFVVDVVGGTSKETSQDIRVTTVEVDGDRSVLVQPW